MKGFNVKYKLSFYFSLAFFLCLAIFSSTIFYLANVLILVFLSTLLFLGLVIYQIILMQKNIIFDADRIVVKRYFLKDFTIDADSVLSFGSHAIKAPNGSIPLGALKSSRTILEQFVEFIDIKNKGEILNIMNQNEPFLIFLNETESKKRQKELKWVYWFGLIFTVLSFLALILHLFVENFPVIFLVGSVIFMLLFLNTNKFEKEETNIKNKIFNKAILPILSVVVTLALLFLLYKVFIYFGIDLIKRTL